MQRSALKPGRLRAAGIGIVIGLGVCVSVIASRYAPAAPPPRAVGAGAKAAAGSPDLICSAWSQRDATLTKPRRRGCYIGAALQPARGRAYRGQALPRGEVGPASAGELGDVLTRNALANSMLAESHTERHSVRVVSAQVLPAMLDALAVFTVMPRPFGNLRLWELCVLA